jgi:glycine/D-amino acid oxidase-like deaminating enzyme
LKVLVVEKDPTYERASTTLSMANARIQFCLKENVQMSQYALDVLEHFEDDMAVDDDPPNILYRQEGNLILVNQDTLVDAQKAFAMQKALGCDIEWWTPEEIKALCPAVPNRRIPGRHVRPQGRPFRCVRAAHGDQGQGPVLWARRTCRGKLSPFCQRAGR